MSEPFEYIRYFFSIPDNKTIHEHLPNGIGFESIIDLMRGYVSKKDRQLSEKDKRIEELKAEIKWFRENNHKLAESEQKAIMEVENLKDDLTKNKKTNG